MKNKNVAVEFSFFKKNIPHNDPNEFCMLLVIGCEIKTNDSMNRSEHNITPGKYIFYAQFTLKLYCIICL